MFSLHPLQKYQDYWLSCGELIQKKKKASFITGECMRHLVIIFVLSVFVYSHFTTQYSFLFQCWQPHAEFVLSLLSSN